MEKWVQILKCIISLSFTKSLIQTLRKFNIRNLDLFCPFFGKNAVYLLTCQHFEMEKKFVPSESRIAFCRLFIVRVQNVCYEQKVRGEILGCVLHCTLRCLSTYVPTTSFRLMVLRNKVECQCYNETNTASPVNSKTQQKIT